MKKILISVICLAVIAFGVNAYAERQIKNNLFCLTSIVYLEYPDSRVAGYEPSPERLSSDIVHQLKEGMSEDEVLKLLGLPYQAEFTDWYDMNLHWGRNFSWDKWKKGELWDRTSPMYGYKNGSVRIVYDEQRNIKELIFNE